MNCPEPTARNPSTYESSCLVPADSLTIAHAGSHSCVDLHWHIWHAGHLSRAMRPMSWHWHFLGFSAMQQGRETQVLRRRNHERVDLFSQSFPRGNDMSNQVNIYIYISISSRQCEALEVATSSVFSSCQFGWYQKLYTLNGYANASEISLSQISACTPPYSNMAGFSPP